MKCIILAGGSGNRLWPLSRKTYPKQFLDFGNNTSIFQETVTRNIPFCDEFFIITNEAYQPIVEGQMQQFMGLEHHIFLEEEGRGTAPAIYLCSLLIGDEEDVFILPADVVINGENYSEAIYRAKDLAETGEIVLFGILPTSSTTSYGYIRFREEKVTRFIEKPTVELAEQLFVRDDTYWNAGMILAKNSLLQAEMKAYAPALCRALKPVSDQGMQVNPNTIRYGKELFSGIDSISIDKCLLEQSERMSVVRLRCDWQDVSDFTAYQRYADSVRTDGTSATAKHENIDGPVIQKNCHNTTVLNRSADHLVVGNDLKDLLIVNTPDATYITSKEQADDIQKIVQQNAETYDAYFNYGPVGYRPWGTREIIHKAKGYRVRRIMLYPGASLSMHSHEKRNENYSVVSGELSIELENRNVTLHQGDGINILPKMMHRLYNDTDLPVIAIEVDTGVEIEEWDMVHEDREEPSTIPSLYRLRPAYKDYLWGGDRLKTMYKKPSPYEITAESWELSAHPAGPSQIAETGIQTDVVAKGMSFLEFIDAYGPQVMGWKAKIFDRFPILVKFIDAKQSLSIQIHPDDDYAFVNEGEFGKNEVWYVMDAAEGAYLYCGLKKPTPKEEIRRRIEENTITEILNRVEVKVGDVVFIPSGTIHAIGEGIFVCEIQQSSNCTYRVYDFGRQTQRTAYKKGHGWGRYGGLRAKCLRIVRASSGGRRRDPDTVPV